MATNSSEDGNYTTIHESLCPARFYGLNLKIFISALNILSAITAFVGNFLIIAALQKVSSLHPHSRLLFQCLATTDLGVGLITQPLFVSFLLSPEQSATCRHLKTLFYSIGAIFGEVSVLTLTAIAVDRLLALMFWVTYRQVVTLRRVRVLVVALFLSSAAIAMTFIYDFHFNVICACVIVLCMVVSTVCYTKIYLILRHHQTQVQVHIHLGPQHEGEAPLNIARYRKTVSSALWVQIILLACYLPFGILVNIFVVTGLNTPSFDLAWDVTFSMTMLNSTLNPFLYCWKIKEVRQAVKDTIKQFFC